MPLTPSPRGRIDQVFSEPQHYKLTREHTRLLRYWREKCRQAGGTYLVGFDRRGRHSWMVVVEIRLPAATGPALDPPL